MRINDYKLVLLYFVFILCFTASGCSKLAPANNDNNYVLPTNRQIDNYLRKNNLSNVISIDAIDNCYVNILYKIGQNGIGFRVVTALKNKIVSMDKVIKVSDGKTIYEKMPEVIVGGTNGSVQFKYVYLNDSISKIAYEMKIVYYDDIKKEDVEILEKTNQKNCFIYSGPGYDNLIKDIKYIHIYDKDGNEVGEVDN